MDGVRRGRRAGRTVAATVVLAALLAASGCGGDLSITDCVSRFNEVRPPQPGERAWPQVVVVPKGSAGCSLLFTDGRVFQALSLDRAGRDEWQPSYGEPGPPAPLDEARGARAGGELRAVRADGTIDPDEVRE